MRPREETAQLGRGREGHEMAESPRGTQENLGRVQGQIQARGDPRGTGA